VLLDCIVSMFLYCISVLNKEMFCASADAVG